MPFDKKYATLFIHINFYLTHPEKNDEKLAKGYTRLEQQITAEGPEPLINFV